MARADKSNRLPASGNGGDKTAGANTSSPTVLLLKFQGN
jgi:hypothetical protein